MTAPLVKGWCPGALRPMLSGDGWVVRVRPPLGRLTQAQAAGIADLSRRCGNGLIDLSSRANIQIRGVTEASLAPLIEGLTALSLTDPDVPTEARRNIVVTPFWATGDDSHRIATDLAARLAAPDAPALPGKFGFAVDAGAGPVLRGVPADIVIERGPSGLLLLCADGWPLGKPVTPDSAVSEAMVLARWFLASGGAPGGRGRMARHLAGGAVLPEGFGKAPADAAAGAAPGPTAAGWMCALAFGQCEAATLAALAAFGPLRATPWRMLLVEGATARPDLPGLIHDPDDPLLHVVACSGAPACPQALQPTRMLARELAQHLVPHLVPGAVLHVSGCAKGCAHPGRAALTLVGRTKGYGLVRDGTAADPVLPLPPGPIAPTLLIEPALLIESALLNEPAHAPHL